MKNLILKAKTEIVSNNLPEFAIEFRKLLKGVNTDLKTDNDFAEAKELVKNFDLNEKELKAAKEKIFESGGLAEINTLINELSSECREVRLKLNTRVKTEEKKIKDELVKNAVETIENAMAKSEMYIYLTIDYSDAAEQIKGKKLLSKMKEALNTYVGIKINAIQIEETGLIAKKNLIFEKIKECRELFNIDNLMNDDDFINSIDARIAANKKAIEDKATEKAERIAENQRRADAKAKADQLAAEARKEPEIIQEYEQPTCQRQEQDLRETNPGNNNLNNGPGNTEKTGGHKGPPIIFKHFRLKIDFECGLMAAKVMAEEIKQKYSINKIELTEVNQEPVTGV